MQTVTKLTQKQIVKSLFSFIFGAVGFYLVFLIMILIHEHPSGFSAYFLTQRKQLITIAVSVVVVMTMLYCYFFFENKAVLAKLLKNYRAVFNFIPRRIFRIFAQRLRQRVRAPRGFRRADVRNLFPPPRRYLRQYDFFAFNARYRQFRGIDEY